MRKTVGRQRLQRLVRGDAGADLRPAIRAGSRRRREGLEEALADAIEHVRTHDSLFRHVANAILGQTPTRNEKANALAQLRERGVFLIDLCADPVDGAPLSTHVPALIRRVRKLAPAKVILIKATVYDNAVDERVPFPGSGQQRRFATAFEQALRG